MIPNTSENHAETHQKINAQTKLKRLDISKVML